MGGQIRFLLSQASNCTEEQKNGSKRGPYVRVREANLPQFTLIGSRCLLRRLLWEAGLGLVGGTFGRMDKVSGLTTQLGSTPDGMVERFSMTTWR